MKRNICSLIILTLVWQLFASALYADDWGPATNGIQMSIRLKSKASEIKMNQPIMLSVCFSNISTNERFRIYRANAIEFDSGYSWSVISPSGKDISPNMEKIRESESWGSFALLPNKAIEFDFNLSHLCKFSEIGTYKIIGRKAIDFYGSNKSIKVVSNPLSVTVVPDK